MSEKDELLMTEHTNPNVDILSCPICQRGEPCAANEAAEKWNTRTRPAPGPQDGDVLKRAKRFMDGMEYSDGASTIPIMMTEFAQAETATLSARLEAAREALAIAQEAVNHYASKDNWVCQDRAELSHKCNELCWFDEYSDNTQGAEFAQTAQAEIKAILAEGSQ